MGDSTIKRPIGAKFQCKDTDVNISSASRVNESKVQESVSQGILSALSAVSFRLEAIERRIDKTEEHIHGKSAGYSGGVGSNGVKVSSPESGTDYSVLDCWLQM